MARWGNMPRPLLAPKWHTAGLVGILLAAVAFGAWFQKAGPAPAAEEHRSAIGLYLTAMLFDWGIFYYVWRFAARSGTSFQRIVGGRWSNLSEVARDVAIAIPFWVVWQAAAVLTHRLLGPNTAKSIGAFLPRTAAEIAVWFAVCAT